LRILRNTVNKRMHFIFDGAVQISDFITMTGIPPTNAQGGW